MPLASTNLTLFCLTSKVLHTPVSTQTNFYTSQLLQTLFYTNHFLQKPTLTPTSYKPAFTQLAFPQTTFYTNQLFSTNHLLHKPGFAPTNLYKPVFTQISFYTNHLLRKPAVHNPWARPKARGVECRNYQITCFQCLQLNDQRTSTVNLLTLSLLSLLSLLRLAFGGGCLRKRLSLDQTELISWATWRFARSMNSWKILKGI